MTAGAQQALRRTMEIYSNTTRFALACNLSNKIIEPIQSRCALLRYTRLNDKQVLKRLMEIAESESVQYTPEGLEALIFTAEGDMRQAINNLQSTVSGFGFVNEDNVFKVCDQPHPKMMQQLIQHCINAELDPALDLLQKVWDMGFSTLDIISTLFKVTKAHGMIEYLKLEFIKEIGFVHMRLLEGNHTILQLSALVAKLCRLSIPPQEFALK
jgi:replication factor C subunit 2/4